nr:Atrophin-1 incomplete domain containing protein [Pandoravirus belohorizontensis]
MCVSRWNHRPPPPYCPTIIAPKKPSAPWRNNNDTTRGKNQTKKKVDEVLAHCGRYNVIHVLDIQTLAASRNGGQEDADAPACGPVPIQSTPIATTVATTATVASSARAHVPRTTIRCTNDGCWLSAKDIVCDALSLWGVHSALPQNTVRRMKDTYPDMFVKRALAGGGAHAPVIDTDNVALFCERCAAAMASAYGEAMRAYARSTRCADSIAHVIERRARHALSSDNPPRVRVRGASAKHPQRSPDRSRATLPPAAVAVAPCLSLSLASTASALGASSAPVRESVRETTATDGASPSALLSSDSEGDLLPEDGWSNNDDDGCGPFQESPTTSSTLSRPGAPRSATAAPLPGQSEPSPQKGRRRSRPSGAGEPHHASDEGTTVGRPAKRRRTASDGRPTTLEETPRTAIERAHDAAVVARVMRQCARGDATDGARSLCVWRWSADRRWRLVAEVRCASAAASAPWEVIREAPAMSGGHEANALTSTPAWIDARDLEALIHRALESPRDLVVLGDSRRMPSLDAFYADDGGRHEDTASPGAAEAPAAERDTVASALDAWLATACRRWARAPHNRSEGLDLFRRAVAFGVRAAGTPCGPRWECLVEDVQNALA